MSWVNNSFQSETFPDCWKLTILRPDYKKGDKKQMENYRPISQLPVFSKILEKIASQPIYRYLINNNLLYKYQSGFRPNFSTTSATCQLLSRIATLRDSGHIMGVVFWICLRLLTRLIIIFFFKYFEIASILLTVL